MKTLFLLTTLGLISAHSSAEDELADKGGYSFLLSVEGRMDEKGMEMPVTAQEVDQAISVIARRLEDMGISERLAKSEGKGGILLKVPGVNAGEAARIVAILEKPSKLELREVSPRNDETDADGKTLAQRVLDGAEIVPGYRAYTYKLKDADGNETASPILLNRRTALYGGDISVAVPSAQQPDAVDVTLDHTGTDKMIALTQNMRPNLDRIAIVLDGEIISAPVLMQVPLGKHFMISGLVEPGEAQALAITLMHPLENALIVKDLSRILPEEK